MNQGVQGVQAPGALMQSGNAGYAGGGKGCKGCIMALQVNQGSGSCTQGMRLGVKEAQLDHARYAGVGVGAGVPCKGVQVGQGGSRCRDWGKGICKDLCKGVQRTQGVNQGVQGQATVHQLVSCECCTLVASTALNLLKALPSLDHPPKFFLHPPPR